MRIVRVGHAVFLLSILAGAEAGAQAVAFQPVVQSFPDGVGMGTTPVVSHDRRYVRIGVHPQFTALEGFDPFLVPAAVSGGGGGGGGLGGLGGIAGLGGNGLRAVPVRQAPIQIAAAGAGATLKTAPGRPIVMDAGPDPGATGVRPRSLTRGTAPRDPARTKSDRPGPPNRAVRRSR